MVFGEHSGFVAQGRLVGQSSKRAATRPYIRVPLFGLMYRLCVQSVAKRSCLSSSLSPDVLCEPICVVSSKPAELVLPRFVMTERSLSQKKSSFAQENVSS